MPNNDMNKILEKTLIIAEIGMTHNGSIKLATELLDAAFACGVDAVKFQTHLFDAESLTGAPSPSYFTQETREAFFKRTAFSKQVWKQLYEYVAAKGKIFISSVFSLEAVDLLVKTGIDIFKIPSGEVTNTPLLQRVSKAGKPVIVSSGMSNWAEIDVAVKTLKVSNKNLALLQCTSSYPCAYEDVGLNLLAQMHRRYRLPVGLSDHTLTNFASFAAVSMGAKIIERHFTTDKNLYGPDTKHSLEPGEMKVLVEGIRAIERMLGAPVDKDNIDKFKNMKSIFEKSIVAKTCIPKGAKISLNDLAFKKPGDGIRADRYKTLLGRISKVNIEPDTKITMEMLEL